MMEAFLIGLGWNLLGGIIGGLIMGAALEYTKGEERISARNLRLIREGKLCECGHGIWAHGYNFDNCEEQDCPCVKFYKCGEPQCPQPRAIVVKKSALQLTRGD